MKRGVLSAGTRWCEGCGIGELAWRMLRKILKASEIRVARVLLRLPFLEQHQTFVEFEVCHVSTYSTMSAFSLGFMTFSQRLRQWSA